MSIEENNNNTMKFIEEGCVFCKEERQHALNMKKRFLQKKDIPEDVMKKFCEGWDAIIQKYDEQLKELEQSKELEQLKEQEN